jgi:hypothetical protein
LVSWLIRPSVSTGPPSVSCILKKDALGLAPEELLASLLHGFCGIPSERLFHEQITYNLLFCDT